MLDGAHGGEPAVVAIQPQAEALDFHGADDLLEGFLEGAADGHGFADALHLGRERFVGFGELLKRPAGHLDDDVVDGGLEARAGGAGDVVLEFVQGVADGEFGGDLGDWEPRRLAGERAGARDAGVHLDHDHLEGQGTVGTGLGLGVDGELDVAAACFDAHGPHDRESRVAHGLIFLVGERENRRDGDAVARVDAHRIDVLDAADDDAVVLLVADDFEFEFLPADHGLVDLHLRDHARGEAAGHDVAVFLEVVGDAAARAAQREGGADDRGEADFLEELLGVGEGVDGLGFGEGESDLLADVLEDLAVFGAMDDLAVGADHLDAEFLQRAVVPEGAGAVERGLAAQGGQDGVDARAALLFELDDLADALGRDRLDVGPIAELRIGHDRRRVAVDQHDAVPLGLEGLAGLRARVVKLAALADDDGTGTQDEDGLDVGAFGHGEKRKAGKREANMSAGRGVGVTPGRPGARKLDEHSGQTRKVHGLRGFRGQFPILLPWNRGTRHPVGGGTNFPGRSVSGSRPSCGRGGLIRAR